MTPIDGNGWSLMTLKGAMNGRNAQQYNEAAKIKCGHVEELVKIDYPIQLWTEYHRKSENGVNLEDNEMME